ncbi:MAG: cupin domain-containing protein [Gaiellaceae bacterium]
MTDMETAKHYSREHLSLREDVPGAKMWAVALEKTMLTYFEVQPHCRFEGHSHESEQITLVLDGELFFDTNGRVVGVKAGEVIAIPSNLPHSVFTLEKAVKAVDAWSPVMGKYNR